MTSDSLRHKINNILNENNINVVVCKNCGAENDLEKQKNSTTSTIFNTVECIQCKYLIFKKKR